MDFHGFSIASCSKYIPEGGSILLHGPKLTHLTIPGKTVSNKYLTTPKISSHWFFKQIHGFQAHPCCHIHPCSIRFWMRLLPEPISGAEMIISLGFLSLASIALGAAAGTWLEAEYLPLGTWLGELGLVGWGRPEILWWFWWLPNLIMFLNVFDVSLDGLNG